MSDKTHIYSIVDIETTGGDPRTDRITEIAIYRHNGHEILDHFCSLVNPEKPIPEFITRITGIDNDMVRDAPRFYEVAREIVEITQDSVFVAHNVRFDYSFVQKEFRQLGYTFSRKLLCTVKLSRKLLPGYPSYSLGKLCRSLEIDNEARHRADGDARATVTLFERLIQQDNPASVQEMVKAEFADIKLPPNLDRSILEAIPDAVGVYYFHDARGHVIYVGKSTHIRKRILSHFQGAYKKTRTIQMLEQIQDISFVETGSELVALLLENEEIKQLQPLYNRAQVRRKFKFAVYTYTDKQGYERLLVGSYDEAQRPVAGFVNRQSAERNLERRVKEYQLCPRLCDLEKGHGRCFYHQLHICQGACVGEEEPLTYNRRVRQVVNSLNYGRGNLEDFLVISSGRNDGEQSVVWVQRGIYRGYTYLDTSICQQAPETLTDAIPYKEETPDVQRIIQGYIKKHPREVTPLPSLPD